MSLFEINLNSNFKFTDQPAFLSLNDFEKFQTLNNVKTSNIPFENHHLHISSESILNRRLHYPYHNDQDSALQSISVNLFDLYQQHFDRNSPTELSTKLFGCDRDTLLYPNWQLFYLGLESVVSTTYEQQQFSEQIENFQIISEIIQKKYWVRSIRSALIFESVEERIAFQTHLYEHLLAYKLSIYSNTNHLIDFLKYLLHLHYIFKENEKYKLMWNLESSYIQTCIYMLMEYQMSYSEIVKAVNHNRMGNQRSDLNDIYIDIVSFVKKRSPYYLHEALKQKINSLINETIEQKVIIDVLNSNETYLEILYSFIDLNQRFYANKLSQHTIIAVFTGVILNIETVIANETKSTKNGLFNSINGLSKKLDSELLRQFQNDMPFNAVGDDFFHHLLILIEKTDSIEKYFMVYYHARNYIAHAMVDFQRFFFNDDKIIIKNVLDSIIFIMFYLEYQKQKVT